MARTGRPPKPTEQHIAEGTLRSRSAQTPVLVGGRSRPLPTRADEPFVRVWNEVVDALESVLDAADVFMVESFVLRLMEAREAERDVMERGLILEVSRVGRDGAAWVQPMENPAAAVARKARVELRQLCDRMGVGPSNRARLGNLGVEGRGLEDELDGLGDILHLRAVDGGG